MEYYNLTVICSKVHADSLHIFFFLSFIYFFSSRKSVHFNMQKFKPHEFYMIQGAVSARTEARVNKEYRLRGAEVK